MTRRWSRRRSKCQVQSCTRCTSAIMQQRRNGSPVRIVSFPPDCRVRGGSLRENRLVQRAPQHCCRRAGAEVLWVESSEGRLLVGQSSYGGDLSPETGASPHLNRPVCERILTQRGSGAPKPTTPATPPPVCEPILTRWGSGTPESAPPRISNTRFVSESSHDGTQTTTNHHRRVVMPPTL